MSTKINFYCTHVMYGQFIKEIFEVIVDEEIHTVRDADDWLDSNIDFLYNKFEFDLVFEWVILYAISSLEEPTDVKITHSVKGFLSFEAPEPIKLVSPINEVKELQIETKRKREYKSAWITPHGIIYYVGFADHNQWAAHWLKRHDRTLYDHVSDSMGMYYYEALQKEGWARILGWTDPPTFVLPDVITYRMKGALREYCLGQEVPYQGFPEILKS